MPSLEYYAKKRRKLAQNLSKFDSLIATPGSFGTAAAATLSLPSTLTIPAGIRWAVSYSATLLADKLVIDINGKNYSIPALTADIIHRGDYVETNKVVTIEMTSDCPAGTITFYAMDEWTNEFAIATGTIS